ncbi:MAG: hypothetical protein MI975_11670 [Cytophagales bacterium]|nr:hypothetical protein [Cytophagales bacterium]
MNSTIKILSAFILLSFTTIFNSRAQSAFEIGLRAGEHVALDATFPLSKAPRFHPSIYFTNDIAIGTYLDWLFSLEGGPQGLKFYPGVGPDFFFGDNFNVGIAGNFGVEYSFDFPLTIGFDYRPGFMITDGFKSYTNNWGFTARFRFVKV